MKRGDTFNSKGYMVLATIEGRNTSETVYVLCNESSHFIVSVSSHWHAEVQDEPHTYIESFQYFGGDEVEVNKHWTRAMLVAVAEAISR